MEKLLPIKTGLIYSSILSCDNISSAGGRWKELGVHPMINTASVLLRVSPLVYTIPRGASPGAQPSYSSSSSRSTAVRAYCVLQNLSKP